MPLKKAADAAVVEEVVGVEEVVEEEGVVKVVRLGMERVEVGMAVVDKAMPLLVGFGIMPMEPGFTHKCNIIRRCSPTHRCNIPRKGSLTHTCSVSLAPIPLNSRNSYCRRSRGITIGVTRILMVELSPLPYPSPRK